MSPPRFDSERTDLAAAFRWFARLGMAESVANHFSVAVSQDGTRFLMNPCRRHFSQIKASELLLLSANDPTALGCLEDSTLYPIDINAARFFGRVAVDPQFAGMALSNDEAQRQARMP